jgi:Primase C terminal 1 (PriCT-1)
VSERAYGWSVDSADCIAEAPAWLLDRVVAPSCSGGLATSPEEWLKLVTAGVDEGARNQAIARLAGLLFRCLPDPEIAAALVACWNFVKCRPPLEALELKRILDSIAAREMRRRGLTRPETVA